MERRSSREVLPLLLISVLLRFLPRRSLLRVVFAATWAVGWDASLGVIPTPGRHRLMRPRAIIVRHVPPIWIE